MKLTRLDELYRRKLVNPANTKRRFPLEHSLQKTVQYFPNKPDNHDFDILEIGPGTGDFLFHLATENTQDKILAVEIGKTRFARIKERLTRRGITNVTLVHADARAVLRTDLKDATFNNIYILFPDPWPKNRHAPNRLLSQDFLAILLQRLNDRGKLMLATDVEEYARWAASNLAALVNKTPAIIPYKNAEDFPLAFPTYFAKKWHALGRSFWYFCHQKETSR